MLKLLELDNEALSSLTARGRFNLARERQRPNFKLEPSARRRPQFRPTLRFVKFAYRER